MNEAMIVHSTDSWMSLAWMTHVQSHNPCLLSQLGGLGGLPDVQIVQSAHGLASGEGSVHGGQARCGHRAPTDTALGPGPASRSPLHSLGLARVSMSMNSPGVIALLLCCRCWTVQFDPSLFAFPLIGQELGRRITAISRPKL